MSNCAATPDVLFGKVGKVLRSGLLTQGYLGFFGEQLMIDLPQFGKYSTNAISDGFFRVTNDLRQHLCHLLGTFFGLVLFEMLNDLQVFGYCEELALSQPDRSAGRPRRSDTGVSLLTLLL